MSSEPSSETTPPSTTTTTTTTHPATIHNVSTPRVTIEFCTQCKWLLRAAYFAQELLSTFNTSLGEVSLIPSTGGVFTVKLDTFDMKTQQVKSTLLWDRKTEGGFPETKELKKRLRNIIDPSRDLGHVDGKKSILCSSSNDISSSSSSPPTGNINDRNKYQDDSDDNHKDNQQQQQQPATNTDKFYNQIAGDFPSNDTDDNQKQTAAKYPQETESLGIQAVLAERKAKKEEQEQEKAEEEGSNKNDGGKECEDCQ